MDTADNDDDRAAVRRPAGHHDDHEDIVIGYVIRGEFLDPGDVKPIFARGGGAEAEHLFRHAVTEAERRFELALAACNKPETTPRGHKRARGATTPDDDGDGTARGAPRRATVTAEGARPAEQLEPAPRDDGSRREEHAPADREPIAAAATSLVSCGVKRDAATQVSEAQLLQAFDTVMRDASTQVSEDEEPSHQEEPMLAKPFGYSSPASEMCCSCCRPIVPPTSPEMQLFPSRPKLMQRQRTRISPTSSTISMSYCIDPWISPLMSLVPL
ncbi:hypothetical protein PVAP13_5KG705800 [Panicum virgatum]|uniref:Uncharacterized protein n=1 Tax=Panicum virgatum TaxID=38727 RepID=A0A8T0T061_PANVG|nr:hypothetical protein PVAP13_5KG705800 [Panicum virgatum]